jgi:glycyl-tRNA synthetase beta chain
LVAKVKSAGLAEQVLEFIFDRLRARYEDEGVDVASTCRYVPCNRARHWTSISVCKPYRRSVKLPEADALAAVNKRVSNLLSKAEGWAFRRMSKPGLFRQCQASSR